MIDNSTDNSCVVSDNSNSSSVKSCKNVNSVTIGNASSSYGNNSSTISNIACNTIPGDNVPTNVNDKMDVSNVNDNMGNLNNDNDSTITWDDVVAMEDSASYTWTRRNGSLSSRIDFFIVPYVWVPSVSFCDIVACPFSDHCAVHVCSCSRSLEAQSICFEQLRLCLPYFQFLVPLACYAAPFFHRG